MEGYLKGYDEGFEHPTGEVVSSWLDQFLLSRKEFGSIVGLSRDRVSRLLLSSEDPKHQELSYAATRLFCIWAGYLNPETFSSFRNTFWGRFTERLKELSMSVDSFCDVLKVTRTRFYQLKAEHPDELKEWICSLNDFENLEKYTL
jgi:hypothetical protein